MIQNKSLLLRLTFPPSCLRLGLYKSALAEESGGQLSCVRGAGHCDEFCDEEKMYFKTVLRPMQSIANLTLL